LPENPVSVIDFVKIKNNHKAEAIYFYQNNWTIYREIALKKKQILSYQILQIKPDSTLDADLILTTVYKDSAQFKAGEAYFTSIIMDTRPNGPKLLDSLKPSDFRLLVATKVAERLVAGNEPSR
jgi:hypothetical protein